MPRAFRNGDFVAVLRACRLPVEEPIGAGVIERVTLCGSTRLYWVSGFLCARTDRELRLECSAETLAHEIADAYDSEESR